MARENDTHYVRYTNILLTETCQERIFACHQNISKRLLKARSSTATCDMDRHLILGMDLHYFNKRRHGNVLDKKAIPCTK